jgi:hypothetical protein
MKELIIIVSSTWKFAATFPIAIYLFKMSFLETILYTNIGGFIGVVVFMMLSKGLIKIFDAFWPKKLKCKRKSSKVFTRRNRRLILLKNKYGLPGIVILTPVLLSIPLGVFLNTKYYGHKKMSYLYLLLGQIGWSFIYTFVYTQVKMAVL